MYTTLKNGGGIRKRNILVAELRIYACKYKTTHVK
jgi:hypothetical protein